MVHFVIRKEIKGHYFQTRKSLLEKKKIIKNKGARLDIRKTFLTLSLRGSLVSRLFERKNILQGNMIERKVYS